jgi:hypothetical protein
MHDTLSNQTARNLSTTPSSLLVEHLEEIISAHIEPCRHNNFYDILCQIYCNFLEITIFDDDISGTLLIKTQ